MNFLAFLMTVWVHKGVWDKAQQYQRRSHRIASTGEAISLHEDSEQ